jgi:hypothetical protein
MIAPTPAIPTLLLIAAGAGLSAQAFALVVIIAWTTRVTRLIEAGPGPASCGAGSARGLFANEDSNDERND